jgi:DNA-binding response OmpR family regulator
MSTILIAEDDLDVRDLVTYTLEQSGHDVISVSDGITALSEARRLVPAVAVLDVAMPGMSGIDVCRQLRTDPKLSSIHVILLTSRKREADVELGFRVGADDYMIKPFSPRELSSRVMAVLTRTRA